MRPASCCATGDSCSPATTPDSEIGESSRVADPLAFMIAAMVEEDVEEKVSGPTLPDRRLGSVLVAMLALALVASLATGTPAKLPGVALGSAVVLHAERTVALFAAVLLVLVVLVRAFQGQLPQELSGRGLKYADRQTTVEIRDTTAVALEELQTAQQELHARVEALEEIPEDEAQGDVPQEGAEG